jgi:hypothetical protein
VTSFAIEGGSAADTGARACARLDDIHALNAIWKARLDLWSTYSAMQRDAERARLRAFAEGVRKGPEHQPLRRRDVGSHGDLTIPGEAFSFGMLEAGQALGDFQSPARAMQRAVRVHLPRPPQRFPPPWRR